MNTVNCTNGCGGCCSCGCNQGAVTCFPPLERGGDYAYIYNTAAQTAQAGAPLTFSSNGPLSGTITHTAGTAEIVVGKTGVYLMTFYAQSTGEGTEYTVYKNGEAAAGSTYAADGTTVNGRLIIAAQIGDVITVVNSADAAATPEAAEAGTEPVVNAAVTITRVF